MAAGWVFLKQRGETAPAPTSQSSMACCHLQRRSRVLVLAQAVHHTESIGPSNWTLHFPGKVPSTLASAVHPLVCCSLSLDALRSRAQRSGRRLHKPNTAGKRCFARFTSFEGPRKGHGHGAHGKSEHVLPSQRLRELETGFPILQMTQELFSLLHHRGAK